MAYTLLLAYIRGEGGFLFMVPWVDCGGKEAASLVRRDILLCRVACLIYWVGVV